MQLWQLIAWPRIPPGNLNSESKATFTSWLSENDKWWVEKKKHFANMHQMSPHNLRGARQSKSGGKMANIYTHYYMYLYSIELNTCSRHPILLNLAKLCKVHLAPSTGYRALIITSYRALLARTLIYSLLLSHWIDWQLWTALCCIEVVLLHAY